MGRRVGNEGEFWWSPEDQLERQTAEYCIDSGPFNVVCPSSASLFINKPLHLASAEAQSPSGQTPPILHITYSAISSFPGTVGERVSVLASEYLGTLFRGTNRGVNHLVDQFTQVTSPPLF